MSAGSWVWGSGPTGRRTVDAAPQHVETADATRLFAQLESEESGAGGHVRGLGRSRTHDRDARHEPTIATQGGPGTASTDAGMARVPRVDPRRPDDTRPRREDTPR